MYLPLVLKTPKFCNMKNRDSLILLSKLRYLGSYFPQEQDLLSPREAFSFWKRAILIQGKDLLCPKRIFSIQERVFLTLEGYFHQEKGLFHPKQGSFVSKKGVIHTFHYLQVHQKVLSHFNQDWNLCIDSNCYLYDWN